MRQTGGGAAVIAVLMLAAASADAKCVPSKYSDSWLQEQEQLGGDTMDRHVGRNASELVAHLAKEPESRSVSSFPDPRTAGQVINAALRPDEDAYDNWARRAKAGERAEVRMAFEQPIGLLVERGNASGVPAHGIRVILEATGQGNCRLVTAFPTR